MKQFTFITFSQLALLVLLNCYGVPAQTPPTAVAPAPTSKSASTLSGRVLGPDGEPLADVQVTVRGRGGVRPFSQSTKTDDEGKFKFTGLPAQQFRLFCDSDGVLVQAAERGTGLHYLGEQVTFNLVKGGVITGRVTDALGEPLVGMTVRAERLRDLTGNVATEITPRSRQTDDRGIYRLFGLEPGVYVVHVKGMGEFGDAFGVQSFEVPTYYPATVRATAAEITVQSGAEISGIDLQHAGRRGHTVSGSVTGTKYAAAEMPMSMTALGLYNPATQQLEQTAASVNQGGFAFQGVSDGEYDVLAFGVSLHENSTAAAPVRVKVSGADVNSVALKLTPLGSVSGRLLREPAACHKGELAFEEVGITAQPAEAGGLYLHRIAGAGMYELQMLNDNLPEATGDFTVRNLPAGRQFLQFKLPPGWYVKAAKMPAAPVTAAAKQPGDLDVGRNGLMLKAGEQLKGLTVTLSSGAASLSGTLESKLPLPARLRVHLIPAEAAPTDELLRYHEAPVDGGRFAFDNLAPGKYWLLAHVPGEPAPRASAALPLAWNTAERAKLRRAAEAAKQEIELSPCQRAQAVILRYAAPLNSK
jgi:hypothetical protein